MASGGTDLTYNDLLTAGLEARGFNDSIKTTLCYHFMKGNCSLGANCNFAHAQWITIAKRYRWASLDVSGSAWMSMDVLGNPRTWISMDIRGNRWKRTSMDTVPAIRKDETPLYH